MRPRCVLALTSVASYASSPPSDTHTHHSLRYIYMTHTHTTHCDIIMAVHAIYMTHTHLPLRCIYGTHTHHSLRYIHGTHTHTTHYDIYMAHTHTTSTHCDIVMAVHATSTEAYTHLPKVPLSDASASASLCSPCQRQSTQHIAHITQHDNTCRQHGTPPESSPIRCLSDQTQ